MSKQPCRLRSPETTPLDDLARASALGIDCGPERLPRFPAVPPDYEPPLDDADERRAGLQSAALVIVAFAAVIVALVGSILCRVLS